MELEFVKMEGTGNDFILLDDRDSVILNTIDYGVLAKKLCNRHFGIGADGIILILPARNLDIGFRIFNSDGSEAQMCGNGMRCFAKYLYENRIMTNRSFKVETPAGTIIPEVITDSRNKVGAVTVNMGQPVLAPEKIPFVSDEKIALMQAIELENLTVHVTAVFMGNPHAVVFVDDVDDVDVQGLGRQIENHVLFPEKTNVEFIEVASPTELKMAVWERGAGITLACGTGACAALVAANLNHLADRRAVVHLSGGDLDIEWRLSDNHVYKTGPANVVFSGRILI